MISECKTQGRWEGEWIRSAAWRGRIHQASDKRALSLFQTLGERQISQRAAGVSGTWFDAGCVQMACVYKNPASPRRATPTPAPLPPHGVRFRLIWLVCLDPFNEDNPPETSPPFRWRARADTQKKPIKTQFRSTTGRYSEREPVC